MLGHNLPLHQLWPECPLNEVVVLGQPLGDVHADTILMSWACMAGFLAFAAAVAPRMVVEGAGGPGQAVLEGLYTFTRDIAKGQIGHKYRAFFPLIAAIFIFVLMGNFIGVGPWRAFEHMPGWPVLHGGEPFELCSPTTDFNVTAGLAAIALIVYLGSGFWSHGLGYLKLYTFNPLFFVEWLDLVVRPSTLALRLMVVITADELMRGAFLTIMPVLLPAGIMGFELFIGTIQAFVFALLTSIYIGLTVAEHH